MQDKFTIAELEERIGYHFNNQMLLRQAVTHSSFTNEQKINKYGHYACINGHIFKNLYGENAYMSKRKAS